MAFPKIKLITTNEVGRRGPTLLAIVLFIIVPCLGLFIYVNLSLGGQEKQAPVREAPPVVQMRDTLQATQTGQNQVGPKGGATEGSDLISTREGEVIRFSPQNEQEIGTNNTLDGLLAQATRSNQPDTNPRIDSDDPLATILNEGPQKTKSTKNEEEMQVIFGMQGGPGEANNQAQQKAGVIKFTFAKSGSDEEPEESPQTPSSNVRYTADPLTAGDTPQPSPYLPIGYRIPVTLMTPVRSFEKSAEPIIRMQVNKPVKYMGKTVVSFGTMIIATMGNELPMYGDARLSFEPRFILYPDGSTTPLQGALRSPNDTYGVQGYMITPPPEKQIKDLAAPIGILKVAEALETTESASGRTSSANEQLTTWAVEILRQKNAELDRTFVPQHVYIPAGTRCYIELTNTMDMSVRQPPVAADGNGKNSTAQLISTAAQATPTGQLATGGTELVMQLIRQNPRLFEGVKSKEEMEAVLQKLIPPPKN